MTPNAILEVEGSTYRDLARRLLQAHHNHAFNPDVAILDLNGFLVADAGSPTATIACACGGVFKVDLPEPLPEETEKVMGQARHPDVTALRCPYDTVKCGQLIQVFGVVSSHLRDAGWCQFLDTDGAVEASILRVRFWGGTVGEYANVTEEWWAGFQKAESKGRALQALKTEKTPWERLR